MNKSELMGRVTLALHRTGLKLQKHSPEILLAAGVVGAVAGAVMACKATTKLGDILDKSKEDIEKIHNAEEHPESLPEPYTAEDAKKDLTVTYIQTGVKIAKLYAPAAAVGALSIAGILASNGILRRRNVAIAAAYTSIDNCFKEYRKRMIERFGEQADQELKHNVRTVETGETAAGEDGTEGDVLAVLEKYEVSGYARFFDKSSRCFDKNPEYNKMFLRAEQQYANDRLRAVGHLFLNEVYDRLDIPKTKAGQIVGWVYDPKNPKGDNFVDFGMCEMLRQTDDGEREPVILLDFNVDGNILDLI